MIRIVTLSPGRRRFLAAGAGGAVLLLGAALPGAGRTRADPGAPGTGILNAFVGIAADGTVTVQSPFAEMGQGTYTAIPMLVMEELDAPMSAVRVVQAPHAPAYRLLFGNTARFTGGSLSVRSSFETLRRMGATARAMLIAAAAERWGVSAGECSTEAGAVVHAASGRRAGYGTLAAAAARRETPADVALKADRDLRLIGRPVRRTDSAAKSLGSARFGIDVRLDGMLCAAVRQCPVFGGEVAGFDAGAIAGLPGVEGVERIPNGVAVLASGHWQAQQALQRLPVDFDLRGGEIFSGAAWLQTQRARLDEAGATAERDGDGSGALQAAARVLRADYAAPFLAHATLEPMNCTALIDAGQCTVWAPNQSVDAVAAVAAEVAGLPLEAVRVETTFLGGGFGRRAIMDFVAQAVTLARARPGRPVQVLWSREEDLRRDHYRPLTVARLRAGLDAGGHPFAFHATTAGDGPMRRHFAGGMQDPDVDPSVVEGLIHLPYGFAHRQVDLVYAPLAPQLGWWRSVGHSMNGFFIESFIDEIAHAGRRDPVELRRALLAGAPRHRTVLDTAVAMAGWRAAPWTAPDGGRRAMGVALHESFGSIVAEVAEVSLDEGEVRVHAVWCAVDCGRVVNPGIIIMQMESGIAYGLSAALHERVTISEGRAQQSNFDDYPVLTAAQMPQVEVRIIESGAAMGGIGEPGTPPIAPAVCNALFTLTGTRVRTLPLAGQALGCKACAPA